MITGKCPTVLLQVNCAIDVQLRKKDGAAYPGIWEEITENIPGEIDSGGYQFRVKDPEYDMGAVFINGKTVAEMGNKASLKSDLLSLALTDNEVRIDIEVKKRAVTPDFKDGQTAGPSHADIMLKLEEILAAVK